MRLHEVQVVVPPHDPQVLKPVPLHESQLFGGEPVPSHDVQVLEPVPPHEKRLLRPVP